MGALIAVVVVIFGIPLAISYIVSALARQEKDLVVHAPQQVVAATVADTFSGMWWREVRGQGDLNYESEGPGLSSMAIRTKPVISVALTPAPGGGISVSIWMSEYGSAWGQIGSPDRVVMKRRKLISRLRALAPVPGVLPAASASAAVAPPQYGGPPQYGASTQYGAPTQHGAPPQYGAPTQHGAPPQYGAPTQHGAPPQYGGPTQYGAPTPAHHVSPSVPGVPSGPTFGPGAGIAGKNWQ